MAEILPSLLAADFSNLREEIRKVSEAKILHFDIMDGNFVPNISFGSGVIKTLRPFTKQIFDTHLMIVKPERYIKEFVAAGSDIITIHVEAVTHLDRVITQVKEAGCRVGVALNPHTSLSVLEYVLEKVDQVLIMTVNPGFGGQVFIPQMVEKIKQLKIIISKKSLKTKIQIDGGVSLDNLEELSSLGIDLFIAGSAVFKADNPTEVLEKMNKIIRKVK